MKARNEKTRWQIAAAGRRASSAKQRARSRANDYNFRVPPAFLKAEGKYDIRPKLKTILLRSSPQGRQELAGEANVCEAPIAHKNSTLAFIASVPHALVGAARAKTWKIVDEFFSALTELTREIGDGIVVADLIHAAYSDSSRIVSRLPMDAYSILDVGRLNVGRLLHHLRQDRHQCVAGELTSTVALDIS